MSSRPHGPARPFGTVVFDCDSTLSSIEGIEDLAVGREDEVRALTDRAMNGELPLEDVYGARLELIRPTAADVERIGARYIETALPHAAQLVSALHHLGKRVAIVSGGLLPPVRALAAHLGIPAAEVDAVGVFFDSAGAYAGFDTDSPLARAGGKLEVVRALAEGEDARPPLVLIGDGATDLEAAPLCERFIAFGGVVRREQVFAAADVTCAVPDLAALVPLILTSEEQAHLAASIDHAALVRAAETLTA
ncbi:MAG: HAD-IB family phosphatase [Planctomycetota bacterium]|nr:HAD-IB family phosphatase [Planctomycetota bacterium]